MSTVQEPALDEPELWQPGMHFERYAGWEQSPLAWVDTETTGVHERKEVWEIGIVRRDPGGRTSTFHTFVDVDLADADPFGLRVGRFYDRHPHGQYLSGQRDDPITDIERTGVRLMTPAEAAVRTARMLHGAHVIGAVPSFDTGALDQMLRYHGAIGSWHYHLICVEVLALGFLAARELVLLPPYKGDELNRALGLPETPAEKKHTALGDAEWAMRVWDLIMEGAGTGHG